MKFSQMKAEWERSEAQRAVSKSLDGLRNSKQTHWEKVVQVLKKHYYEPDIEAARILYAAVAAHELKGQPVWPMAVAPPGSMKSELVSALDGLHNVHVLDSVTPKTFISGQIVEGPKQREQSLLHRIGKSGIIVCSDFSTVLAMRSEDRNAVMADLRKIFDGRLSKEFGTSEEVPGWDGRITLVAAVTPKIDTFGTVIQSLGDRFVMVRWQRGSIEATKRAMTQDIESAQADLKNAVHTLISNLPQGEVALSESFRDRIAAIAELAVIARAEAVRERDKRLKSVSQPESSTRLGQQLGQLAKGSARLEHRDSVNETDLSIALRSGFDAIPPNRRLVLEAASEGRRADLPGSTRSYAEEELEHLGLLDKGALSLLGSNLLGQAVGTNGEAFTMSLPHANNQIHTGPSKEVGTAEREGVGGIPSESETMRGDK